MTDNDPTRQVFTRDEAADYLGVSIATLDRMIRDRDLETFKVRGLRRISLASIQAMIERNTPRSRRKRVS